MTPQDSQTLTADERADKLAAFVLKVADFEATIYALTTMADLKNEARNLLAALNQGQG